MVAMVEQRETAELLKAAVPVRVVLEELVEVEKVKMPLVVLAV
jgi:hypothetical protein